ncbi:galactosyltransferase-related protein [Streptomyces roseoverticillatus]|uniref:galactosyltransferase-related protein n=1 Tax=Streptomyces roseoverticillatus TaxID=66429 RepID=UPI0004C27CBE|nr:galactosyltransferase-related protein [Streptomyces roseoverticillatus]
MTRNIIEVSVIIPLYGHHAGRASVAAVAAAWLSQDVPCEVILATAGDMHLGDTGGARLLCAPPGLRAPGLLRNAGAAVARGRMLYLSDSDVAPLGRDYLSRALAAARDHGGAWAQPWMYRLDGPARRAAVVDLRPGPGTGGRPYCMVTADSGGTLHPCPGEVISRQRMEHCGAVTELPVMYPPPGTDRHPGDLREWRAPFHWGAMLLGRRLFEEVGGYCRGYYGWGCEDDDLFVKVASRAPVAMGWADPGSGIGCLHFEHPYPYSGTPEREANSTLYARRVAEGAAAMIEEDLTGARAARV